MATKSSMEVGSNVTAHVDGNILTLTMDISKRLGESKSGKSDTIATTSGNVKINVGGKVGDITLGLNLYKKK